MNVKNARQIELLIEKVKEVKKEVDSTMINYNTLSDMAKEDFVKRLIAQNYIVKDELFNMIQEKNKEDRILSFKCKVYFWPFSLLIILTSLFI